jgi:hypothetical protein
MENKERALLNEKIHTSSISDGHSRSIHNEEDRDTL